MVAKSKQSAKKQTEVIKKPHFLQRHLLLMPLVCLLTLFFIGLSAFVSVGGQTVGAADTHVATVYFDNKQQTVPTRSKDVEDLLKRLNITVGAKDVVEPALNTPIVEDNFKVYVYRSRSVEVIDGVTKTVVQSATKAPRLLAQEAGTQLYSEDSVSLVRSESDLKGPIVAERLVIERSVPIQVSLYGVIALYRTTAKTIDGFLEEKNIVLKAGDTTQPADGKQPIVPGMLLSVNTKGRKIVAIEEDIAYDTQTRNNPAIPAGQKKVVQAGVTGRRAVLYEQTLQDSTELGRRQIQTVVLREPVTQITEKGTLAAATYSVSADKATIMAAAGIDASQFASVDYIISKESGWRPGAVNSQGCIGLGQRCPSGGSNALVSACPSWQTDPVCQLRHFSAYANGRYGSWNSAYQTWQVQRWW